MDKSQDLEIRQQTWQGFTKLITYSTLAAVVILALMAIFLL